MADIIILRSPQTESLFYVLVTIFTRVSKKKVSKARYTKIKSINDVKYFVILLRSLQARMICPSGAHTLSVGKSPIVAIINMKL